VHALLLVREYLVMIAQFMERLLLQRVRVLLWELQTAHVLVL
jgi:hypothetical protein